MKRDLVRLVGGILLGGAAMLVLLPACRGSAGETAPVPTVQQATATARPTTAPAPTPTAAPAPTATAGATQPTPQPAGTLNSDIFAKGKLVFEKTAGGVGCAYCHGMQAKGDGVPGLGAPDIRGRTEDQVRTALQNVVLMGFIKLTDEEIMAVVAHLQYLNRP